MLHIYTRKEIESRCSSTLYDFERDMAAIIHQLLAENEALVEALEFYADEANYWEVTDSGKCQTMTNADQGIIARETLARRE